MAAPNQPQGTINRIRGAVTLPDHPELNVTSSFLGKEGIRLSFDGNSTTYIDTMVAGVTSPEPYMKATITVHLLKTQNLSDLYKKQMESLALIGDATVRSDAQPLSPWGIINCAIQTVRELDFSGGDAGYVVSIGGYYPVNNSLFG